MVLGDSELLGSLTRVHRGLFDSDDLPKVQTIRKRTGSNRSARISEHPNPKQRDPRGLTGHSDKPLWASGSTTSQQATLSCP